MLIKIASLVVLVAVASCRGTSPFADGDSSLNDSEQNICQEGEDFVPFSLVDTDATPDLESLGFAGNFSLKKPSAGETVRLDVCMDSAGNVRLVRIFEGSTTTDSRSLISVRSPEIAGLSEALFEDRYDNFRVYIMAAGILPYYLVQGFVVDGKSFIIASRVAKSQGTTKLASTSNGWFIGRLVQSDPFPTPDRPCGEFSGKVPFTESMQIGEASISIKGCERFAVGEGSSWQDATEVKVADPSPSLAVAARGERIFTGSAAAAIYQGGLGHHGCYKASTVRLPEVLYHQRLLNDDRKRVKIVQYGGHSPIRTEEPAPDTAQPGACSGDPGDPPLLSGTP